MGLHQRRLCVYFSARSTRYAVEAVSVLEVAQGAAGQGSGSLVPRHELGELLGGEPRPPLPHHGTSLVLDSSPTVAIEVTAVEGVFDCSGDERLPLPGRMIPHVAPAVRHGLVHDGALVFELDPEGVLRGLGAQRKLVEVATATADVPTLACEVDGAMVDLPLSSVLQVIPVGPLFNPAPSEGTFAGALAYRGQLCPVYRVPGSRAEPLIAVCEAGGGLLGVLISRAVGVAPRARGPVLDLERMFS